MAATSTATGEVDVALILGNQNWITKSATSTKKLIERKFPRARVATISYSIEQENSANRDVFYSTVEGFSGFGGRSDGGQVKTEDGTKILGNPLQHALALNYRQEAVKMCFLIADAPPFIENITTQDQQLNDEHLSNEQINEIRESRNKENTEMEEKAELDPMLACHLLAAKGVVLYCISMSTALQLHKDTFMALSYTTGGQYVELSKTGAVAKVISTSIQEEMSLEGVISQATDFLCVQWQKWGRGMARVPKTQDEFLENLHNYLQTNGIKAIEMLESGTSLPPVNRIAKRMASLPCLEIARKQALHEQEVSDWTEFPDEVIQGYNIVVEQLKEVGKSTLTLSQPKALSRNQTSRLLVRTLARRTWQQPNRYYTYEGEKIKRNNLLGKVNNDKNMNKLETPVEGLVNKREIVQQSTKQFSGSVRNSHEYFKLLVHIRLYIHYMLLLTLLNSGQPTSFYFMS